MRLRPDPGLTWLQGGRVLLGGSPYRLLRLNTAAARTVASWWIGAPVSPKPAVRALARRLLDAGMAHPDVTTETADGQGSAATVPATRDVTVVIPVRDRVPELVRCLAAIGDLRAIVVDDCSADPNAVAAAAAAAGARYLHRGVGGGPGAARNTGLAAADTAIVAFVDSDCVPRQGWLRPLLRHFADPAVAAVAPRIVAQEEPRSWLARYEAASSALDMGPAASIVRPGARVPYLPGAALAVRKAALTPGVARAGIAGFAEDMPVGEDVDLVWRLGGAGWHVRYEPTAIVAHQHRVQLRQWFARRADYGTSAAPLELRHPGTVPALTMSGWSALAWLAAIARRPGVGVALTVATTALLGARLAPFADEPYALAGQIAGRGTIAAGRLVGSALSRTWWPIALPAAVAAPRLRAPLAVLVLASPLLDWRERRPGIDPVRYVAARLLDDIAYSVGVWRGCLQHRTARPLRPRLWWWSSAGAPGGPRPLTRARPDAL